MKATEFREITQNNGDYAVQGHSRSPILVPIESSYATSYYRLILTYLLSCTVSKLWPIIGQIFAITILETFTSSFYTSYPGVILMFLNDRLLIGLSLVCNFFLLFGMQVSLYRQLSYRPIHARLLLEF